MNREIHSDCDHEQWIIFIFFQAFGLAWQMLRKVRKRTQKDGQKLWAAEWESAVTCCVPVAVYSLQTWTWSPQCRWSKSWRCQTPPPAPSPLVLAALLLNCMQRERGMRSKCSRYTNDWKKRKSNNQLQALRVVVLLTIFLEDWSR